MRVPVALQPYAASRCAALGQGGSKFDHAQLAAGWQKARKARARALNVQRASFGLGRAPPQHRRGTAGKRPMKDPPAVAARSLRATCSASGLISHVQRHAAHGLWQECFSKPQAQISANGWSWAVAAPWSGGIVVNRRVGASHWAIPLGQRLGPDGVATMF